MNKNIYSHLVLLSASRPTATR